MSYCKTKSGESRNIYQNVTDYIIEELEKGSVPWMTSWGCYGPPRNMENGYVYHGWNTFFLNYITASNQYRTPFYLTSNQVVNMGGSIKENETGYPVVYWKKLITDYKALRGGINENREKEYSRSRFNLRSYMVYNIDQTKDIDFVIPVAHEKTGNEKITACEGVIQNIHNCPPIRHGGDYAKYYASMDYIQMPHIEQFIKPEYYYQNLFRELIHFTGHPVRLNRKELEFFIPGDDRCVKEELTSELGTAYLCAYTGIEQNILENNSSYITSWLRRFQNDKTLLIKAATQAEAAVKYILNVQWNDIAEIKSVGNIAV